MMLTDLAIAARKSGLKVVERPGWKTRGHGQMSGVKTIVAHHDVTPKSLVNGALEYIEREILSQLTLARDGTVYVVAAGLCYHAGVVHHVDQSNAWAIGIEAAHSGSVNDPWPPVQYDAYVRLCRALADHYNRPTSSVLGHKEVAKPTGRKSDPTFDMDEFRAKVAEKEEDVELTDIVGTNPASGAANTVKDALNISQHYSFKTYQETVAQRASFTSLLGAIQALNEGEPFDEQKLLDSIQERVREGARLGITDAVTILNAATPSAEPGWEAPVDSELPDKPDPTEPTAEPSDGPLGDEVPDKPNP